VAKSILEKLIKKLLKGFNMFKYLKSATVSIQPARLYVQIGFALLTIWIGIEFLLYVNQLELGQEITVSRPPGVEAFLPISALISLKYWVTTGIFNTIHPSALVLLLTFVVISVLLKKGFCSWICPFGLFSEFLTKIHKKIFDRQFKLPRWLDYPLRSLKYLLLLFFAYAVFVEMSVSSLKHFIYSPYNRVADIKMLQFFTHMDDMTMWILILLVLFSIAIPFSWCRYLCPYGAFLGMLSWLSPFKINRNKKTCIDCEECTLVCPSNISVHKSKTVFSDECHACLQCVDVCPEKDTLYLSVLNNKHKMKRKIYAFSVIGIFLFGIVLANIFGVWHNSIKDEEYKIHIKNLNKPEYFHDRGEAANYDREKWDSEKNNQKNKIKAAK
jgi:polyferredoxin